MKFEDMPVQRLSVESIDQIKMAADAFLSLCNGFNGQQLNLDYTRHIEAAVADGIPAEFEANRIMRVVGNTAADCVKLLLHLEATFPKLTDHPPAVIAAAWLRHKGLLGWPQQWKRSGDMTQLPYVEPVVTQDDRIVKLIASAESDDERAQIATAWPIHVQLFGILNDDSGAGIPYLQHLAAGHDPTEWKG